jgi:hypothetical protein
MHVTRVVLLALAIATLCSQSSVKAIGGRVSPPSVVTAAAAQPEVRGAPARRVTVRFPRSRSNVSLAGRLRGYEVVDYVLHAQARQHMTVRLTSSTRPLTMAVYDPDKRAVCVEACVERWSGPVARTGDYVVRVGLSRAEARRNRTVRYQIQFTLTSN